MVRIDTLIENHREQLASFESLLRSYNQKMNLVSRKTEGAIFDQHILHSLALGAREFVPGSVLVDWGSGGGLPAIPLAVTHPEITVVAVDASFKKTQAIQAISRKMGLTNVRIWNGRAENWMGTCDYSISRATAPLGDLWTWHKRCGGDRSSGSDGPYWMKGLLCLKGGDLSEEIADLEKREPELKIGVYSLAPLLRRPYYREKVLVHVHSESGRPL